MTFGALLQGIIWQVVPVVVVMTMLLLIARYSFSGVARLQKYSFTKEALEEDNKAVLIRLAGFFFATMVAFKSTFEPAGLGILFDLSVLFSTVFMALVALFASMWVNDALILHHFDNNDEVVKKKNVAVAIVEASTMIATAFIFSGAFTGNDNMFVMEVVWFVIGQAMLICFAVLYRFVIKDATFRLQEQNEAVALSMGGFLLGSGIALGNAVAGPFNGWVIELLNVGLYMLVWILVMVMLRIV